MSILFVEETPARETPTREASTSESTRISRVTSCESLIRFGLDLYSERIRPLLVQELPGLGRGFERGWSRLVTLCCPSDCDRVALALTTRESDCSCSPSYPTPTASDWKGSTGKGSRRGTLAERVAIETGDQADQQPTVYPHPDFVEVLMGFPTGWSDLGHSETPCLHPSLSGSDDD